MTARRLRRTLTVWTLAALTTFGIVGIGTAAHAGEPEHLPAAPAAPEHSPGGGSRLNLLAEARGELKAMKRTRYQHETVVHPAKGEFFYDCSGFLDYALERSAPTALQALPHKREARPLAEDFVHHLQRVTGGAAGGPWRAVRTASALEPGDLIAWLVVDGSKTKDTGHVVIVLEPPVRNPQRTTEWLVTVVDSTPNPHAADSRTNGVKGLGTGTIGLDVDASDHPVGFYWKGGESPKAKQTEVVLGEPG
jgi:hypothetical protein